MHAKSFEVNHDNKALPKNIPQPGAPVIKVNSWGRDGIYWRATSGRGYEEPSFTNGWSPHNKMYLKIFVNFLPFMWLQNVLLAKTSECTEKGNPPPLMLDEVMQYLGMRLLDAARLDPQRVLVLRTIAVTPEGGPLPL